MQSYTSTKKIATTFLLFISILVLNTNAFAQASVLSSNGWRVTVNVTPKTVITSSNNYEWYYLYDLGFDYTVTFSGSNTNRNFSYNLYFTTSGGSPNTEPYAGSYNFTSNAAANSATTNHTRGYSAVSSFNYGSNPSYNNITLADVNPTKVRVEYWGNGVTNGSITFNLPPVALPVQLIDFTAKAKNSTVDLSWTTATETNNNYFSVQRSADGSNYETIATVKGAGNSSTKLQYSYIDESPLTGTSYYRLMQTDNDNQFEVFNSVAVTFDRASNNLNVYPNPTTNNNINLTFSATENATVSINIMDISGRELFNKSVIANEGDNNVQLDASLAKGTYFLRVLNNQKSTVKTLIIE